MMVANNSNTPPEGQYDGSGDSRNNGGIRPRKVRINPSTRLDGFRSSLQTNHSMDTHLSSSAGNSSYDVYQEEDEMDETASCDEESVHEALSSALVGNNHNNSTSSRLSNDTSSSSDKKNNDSSAETLQSSFNNSLMVSFPSLNEQELSHLRKWNRRLQRTEVFDKYYFPEKWEQMEMNALIDFLNLDDPTVNNGRSGVGNHHHHREGGGGLRNSGGRRQPGKRRGSMVGSFKDPPPEKGGLGRLATSVTSSFNSSSEKITKLVNPKAESRHQQKVLDPVKATKLALESIFFPYVHDRKSVLLKRGSVFLYNRNVSNERDLMLFSNGFLLANFGSDDVFRLYLALSDREFVTEKSFLDFLRVKFKEMDEEGNGDVATWKLHQLFTDLGLPMCESIIDGLVERCDNDREQLKWEVVHKVIQFSFANNQSSSHDNLGNSDNSLDRETNKGGLKKIFGSFQKEVKSSTKVESASVFSSVVRVDSLNICHGEDSMSTDIANSSQAQLSFSVTLKERKSDPLIFLCTRPEYRDAWVDSFVPVVIPALKKSSSPDLVELRKKLGWQYLIIRSSFVSHVIGNDVELLECCLQDNLSRDHKVLDVLDDYNGYSALHYATILGYTECMDVLLEAGAKVTVKDRNGLSPMYHALRKRNDEVADMLEKYGADRNDDLRKVISDELEEQENKAIASGVDATDGEDLDMATSEDSMNEALMNAARTFG